MQPTLSPNTFLPNFLGAIVARFSAQGPVPGQKSQPRLKWVTVIGTRKITKGNNQISNSPAAEKKLPFRKTHYEM